MENSNHAYISFSPVVQSSLHCLVWVNSHTVQSASQRFSMTRACLQFIYVNLNVDLNVLIKSFGWHDLLRAIDL